MSKEGNRPNQTSKEYFQGLNIIYFGLLLGQVVFMGVTFFIDIGSLEEDDFVVQVFKILVPLFMALGFLGSTFITKRRLQKIVSNSDIKEKFRDYYSIFTMKLAMLEGPTLFALIAFFISSNRYFLILAAVMILIFFTKKPSKDSVAKELELDMQEQRFIENDDTIIT